MRQVPGTSSVWAAFGGHNLPVLPPGVEIPSPSNSQASGLPLFQPPSNFKGEVTAKPGWLQGGELEGLPGVSDGHIAQAFREIDFADNHFIGVSELRMLMVLHGERPSDEELDEMVRMVDRDGNGKIAYEDFLQLFEPGNVVHTEMTSMAPEEISADLSGGTPKGPPRPTDKRQANLVMKSAASFLYSEVRRQNDQERKKALPQAKKDPLTVGRTRPGGRVSSLPMNARTVRNEKQASAAAPKTSGTKPAGSTAAYLRGGDSKKKTENEPWKPRQSAFTQSLYGVTGDSPQGPATPSASPPTSRQGTPAVPKMRSSLQRTQTWTNSGGGMGQPALYPSEGSGFVQYTSQESIDGPISPAASNRKVGSHG